MTCPHCGLETLPDQKFCRACGAGLQLTTQPLPQPVTVTQRENRSAIRTNATSNRTNNFMLTGFITIFVGAAVGVIGKKLMHDDLVSVIGVLISLIGMFLMVFPHLSPPRRRIVDAGSSVTDQLSESRPVRTLPQESKTEYVPSITERTTDLLEAARPKRNESGASPD